MPEESVRFTRIIGTDDGGSAFEALFVPVAAA
jgi:hypothetical protein